MSLKLRIIKHHLSPDEHVFRVMQSEYSFLGIRFDWTHTTSYSKLEHAEGYIRNRLAEAAHNLRQEAATPSDEHIGDYQ